MYLHNTHSTIHTPTHHTLHTSYSTHTPQYTHPHITHSTHHTVHILHNTHTHTSHTPHSTHTPQYTHPHITHTPTHHTLHTSHSTHTPHITQYILHTSHTHHSRSTIVELVTKSEKTPIPRELFPATWTLYSDPFFSSVNVYVRVVGSDTMKVPRSTSLLSRRLTNQASGEEVVATLGTGGCKEGKGESVIARDVPTLVGGGGWY